MCGSVTFLNIILGDKVRTPLQLLDPQELCDLAPAHPTISPSCPRNSLFQLYWTHLNYYNIYLGMRKLTINNLCKIIRHISYFSNILPYYLYLLSAWNALCHHLWLANIGVSKPLRGDRVIPFPALLWGCNREKSMRRQDRWSF